MKRRIFLIPSLVAAGFLPAKADAMPLSGVTKKLDPQSVLERLKLRHIYSLAGHRSHSSHSSHSSHTSHSSGSGGGYLPRTTYSSPSYDPAPAPAPPPAPLYAAPTYTAPAAPNPVAPPPSTIAPARVLPGNAAKFKQIVILVQSGLTAYGYYAGSLTGVVDEDTRAALSQMQRDNNLKVTGTITTEVLTAFGIEAR